MCGPRSYSDRVICGPQDYQVPMYRPESHKVLARLIPVTSI
jgi:hypothetical protein